MDSRPDSEYSDHAPVSKPPTARARGALAAAVEHAGGAAAAERGDVVQADDRLQVPVEDPQAG